jgi:DNA recombination protein RmuC
MEILLIILIILVLGLTGAIVFLVMRFIKTDNKEDPSQSEGMQMLLQQINELGRSVDQKLGDTSKEMNRSIREQTNESYKVIKDITERLTKLDEANKQVMSFTEQLQSLQDILKNPKHRGILGEYYLETLLKNALPPESYQMQYNLGKDDKTGQDLLVDAAVFVKDKIVPIDSKFSLENYNRFVEESDKNRAGELEKVFVNDLKERIKETSKYVRPDKGTMEFAFMFIPHEAIYYDLLTNRVGDRGLKGDGENLIERSAREYKVLMVSPTSFLAYLQTVLQGLKALQIEETAKDIIKRVSELGAHIGSYEKHLTSLGKSLGTTVNHYEKAHKELKKVDKDVTRITGDPIGIEPLSIEKPELD